MATRMHAIVSLLVITLCCIGIVEGGYRAIEALMLHAMEKSANARPKDDAESLAGQSGTGKKHDHRIILARNLFGAIPGNGGGGAAVDALDSLEASGLGVVLMGTIGDREGGDRAIILDKKTGKQQIYRQGDTLQGKTVKDIRRGKVILTANGLDEILDIREAAKLRPVTKNVDSSLEKPKSPGFGEGEVVAEHPTGEERQAVDLPQQTLSGEGKEIGQSGNRIIRPVIIRPHRPPAND